MFTLALASGCANSQKRPGTAASPEQPLATASPIPTPSSQLVGPPDPYGPLPELKGPAYGPDPMQFRPITLVLGPGLARGYAFAGALKALEEAKIPIKEIIGTEMGACMAALYALSKSVNEFDWALLHFKEEIFVDHGINLFDKAIDGKRLDHVLEQILGKKDLVDARVHFRVSIQRLGTGQLVLLERGPATAAVRAALGVPGVMKPAELADGSGLAISSGSQRPFSIAELKPSSPGPIVVIDVLDPGNPALDPKVSAYFQKAKTLAKSELKGADLVIRPDLRSVGYLDFMKKTDAVFKGRSAVQAHLKEIRQLVGMPQ